ncbi:hypothetical protein FIBSPDRAFT_881417 [Athelia psychrophila]|uniref:Uncharacterized protein n=1 Tax=Athelia psychrophila TaxID=1759441 RepID=A0A166WN83_9AGAM|nr:hypothetical protein FIBSPDRAFT_881417 [Fibularhizoctonia sp. CBS 109695]
MTAHKSTKGGKRLVNIPCLYGTRSSDPPLPSAKSAEIPPPGPEEVLTRRFARSERHTFGKLDIKKALKKEDSFFQSRAKHLEETDTYNPDLDPIDGANKSELISTLHLVQCWCEKGHPNQLPKPSAELCGRGSTSQAQEAQVYLNANKLQAKYLNEIIEKLLPEMHVELQACANAALWYPELRAASLALLQCGSAKLILILTGSTGSFQLPYAVGITLEAICTYLI